MKQLLSTLLFIISTICSTSCGTIYLEAVPVDVSTMEIAAEGGSFHFKVIDYYESDYVTRFQPGEWHKDYRYRVVEDGIAGEESENTHETYIYLDFEPNNSDHTKEYTIDIKVAKDFYKVEEEHLFGEWQTVWRITQPSMFGE